MAGPGSGRRKEWWYVSDCRVLVIGELTAHGRLEREPAGEIRWLRGGLTQARLTYTLVAEPWTLGVHRALIVSYQQSLDMAPWRERIELRADKPDLAYCYSCGRPSRKLYALPEGVYFRCRRCLGLGYQRQRRQPWELDPSTILGPLLDGLYDRPTRADRRVRVKRALLESLTEDVADLGPLERRAYCVRLSRAGYSCREIARFVRSSKSSVQRYLTAGSAAIDRDDLMRERLWRYARRDPVAVREMAERLKHRRPEPEPEEMVLTFGEPQAEGGQELPD